MSKEIPCPKCGHVWLWADWKKDKDAFCPKGYGCANKQGDRIEELERKLAKAVEALEKVSQLVTDQYADQLYTQTTEGWEHCGDHIKEVARTTLAELSSNTTGGKDE